MKRMKYVDNDGNTTNVGFESKKPFLRVLLAINILLPIIVIGFMIYTVFVNKKCVNIYDKIKKASLVYLKDQGEVPSVEGDNSMVSIGDLYSEDYLRSVDTNDILCSGTVKVTKYKDSYIYTLDVKNCDKCSVDKKYKGWSDLSSNYPKGRAIVDVVPFYNYYDRELNVTKWSAYFDDDELLDEVSEYGIRLPINEKRLPEIPEGSLVTNIESDTAYNYRYRDRSWKWYNKEGDYSSFSSERPEGFANKDQHSERYTEWSDYSLNYPAEKSYREIGQTTGYKYYYTNKSGKKIYYNSGKYTPSDEVNTSKYKSHEEKTAPLYRYRDKQWRWYNGEQRVYSGYSVKGSEYTPIKDKETEQLGSPTNWYPERRTNEINQEYRVEERKIVTRFRKQYEILSLQVLKYPLEKDKFEKKIKSNLVEFSSRDDKKIEVSYKFKYRKS